MVLNIYTHMRKWAQFALEGHAISPSRLHISAGGISCARAGVLGIYDIANNAYKYTHRLTAASSRARAETRESYQTTECQL